MHDEQTSRLQHARDLALFNTAIDTMLRSGDLLALTVEDVTNPMGEVLMASPAISGAMIFVRSIRHLYGIGGSETRVSGAGE